MKVSANNKAKVVAVLLSLIALVLGLTGCGGNQAAGDASQQDTPTASSAPSAAPKTTAIKSTTAKSTTKATTTTKKVVPKLTDISFTLTPAQDQDAAEYTTPIYMLASQTLHLNWLVVKGNDYFYMTFTLPDGKFIAIRNDGGLSGHVPGDLSDKLKAAGSIVFCPADNNWKDGYYIFHPKIYQDDPSITIKLLYYVE
jgi:hypothetical protein